MLRRSRTRMSRIEQEAVASASVLRTPLAGRMLINFARMWIIVRWLWAGVLVCATLMLMLALVFREAASRGWLRAPTLAASAASYLYPLLVGVWAFALLSLCIFAAYQAQLVSRRRTLAPYVLRAVRRVNPATYVPHYVDGVYLFRTDAATGISADDTARAALFTAAAYRHGSGHRWTLGICVYGRPTQGKTRLAWEAMRAALPGWTFVRWTHTLEPLDLTTLRGRRVALWLDDLHEYANQNEAVVLNDLPARLEAAGARVVVVATCRDGEEEVRACKYLASLIQRLTPIRITNISSEAAEQLVVALAKAGVCAPRESFAQTPGSILLDVHGMRTERYPTLPESAQQVLRTLKLLRSARIFTYPAERVRATAVDLFGLPPAAWANACAALTRTGFIRLDIAKQTNHLVIQPAAAAYLDVVVPEYLNPNAETGDDWPWLQESLERHHDGEALLALGNAYAEQRPGPGPFLPSDPMTTRLQSAMCFRAALDIFRRGVSPYCWAVTQANLAAALARLAELAQGIQRTDLRRQSSAAYQAALEIFTRETNPASWALTQYSLAELHYRRAADAVYLGDTEDACRYLRQARRHVERALTVYSRDNNPAHFRQVKKLRSSILTAMAELDCSGDEDDE